MSQKVPLHMRCGSNQRARHKHNREIMKKELYVPDSEFEPDLIRDTDFQKSNIHPMERRTLQQLSLEAMRG